MLLLLHRSGSGERAHGNSHGFRSLDITDSIKSALHICETGRPSPPLGLTESHYSAAVHVQYRIGMPHILRIFNWQILPTGLRRKT